MDGLQVKAYCEEKDFSDKFELDGEEHRVTFYLPSHEWGTVKSFALSDGAKFERAKYDTKLASTSNS